VIWPCKGVATHAIAQPPAAGTNVGREGPHDARAPHSLNQTVNAWHLLASDLLDLKFLWRHIPKQQRNMKNDHLENWQRIKSSVQRCTCVSYLFGWGDFSTAHHLHFMQSLITVPHPKGAKPLSTPKWRRRAFQHRTCAWIFVAQVLRWTKIPCHLGTP